MADKSSERENLAKKLKRNFDSWREIVLILNSVFLWKKQPYPWMIVGLTTVVFGYLYYTNPSFLTSLSIIGFLLAILDFIIPVVSSTLWKQENWSALKERELEEMCRNISNALISVKCQIIAMKEMRSSRPNTFYAITIIALAALAYIGNSINNLLITYFFVLSILMMPGLVHYGIVQKVYQTGTLHLANLLHSISASPKKIQ